jgi:hypothetical protein
MANDACATQASRSHSPQATVLGRKMHLGKRKNKTEERTIQAAGGEKLCNTSSCSQRLRGRRCWALLESPC